MKNVSLIPEICVHDARGALAFYRKAFQAKGLSEFATPDGKKIMHAALELHGGVVFVCDDFPEASGGKARSPKHLGGSPVTIHLNCPDVHRTWKKAVAAGAKIVLPLERQFWGDVYGILVDPFGQRWSMSASEEAQKPGQDSEAYKAGAETLYPTKARKARKRKAKARAGRRTSRR